MPIFTSYGQAKKNRIMEKHTTKITSKSIEQSGQPSDYKKAIAEYIWNGFDAKAYHIDIDFKSNQLASGKNRSNSFVKLEYN